MLRVPRRKPSGLAALSSLAANSEGALLRAVSTRSSDTAEAAVRVYLYDFVDVARRILQEAPEVERRRGKVAADT
jgi:hypothetical protein